MEACHARIKKFKCANQYTLVYMYHVPCSSICYKKIIQNPNHHDKQGLYLYYFFNSIFDICKYLLNVWFDNEIQLLSSEFSGKNSKLPT